MTPAIARPILRISYQIIPMDDDRVQFRKGPDVFIIRGQGLPGLAQNLFPLLTGEHTLEDIVERLKPDFGQERIEGLIDRLVQRRVVEEAGQIGEDCPRVPRTERLYFSNFTEDTAPHLGKLAGASVLVAGLGPLGAGVAGSLAKSGVGRIQTTDGESVDEDDVSLVDEYRERDLGIPRTEAFTKGAKERFPDTCWITDTKILEHGFDNTGFDYVVVCLERYRPDILSRINTHCLASGIPFTWCCLDGYSASIGPTLLPFETACFECYRTRVKANADHPEALQAYEDYLMANGNDARFGYLAPHIHILAGLTALEVIKDLSALTPPLTYNAQLEVNLLTMEFDLHPVLKLPRCPSCGRLASSGAAVRPFMERQA